MAECLHKRSACRAGWLAWLQIYSSKPPTAAHGKYDGLHHSQGNWQARAESTAVRGSRLPAVLQFCFGKAVRQIVEGETRFSKIGAISESASRAELAALDLKQLFLAMTEEVRIIVVKLADRLHNMRTMGSMPAHKQQKIAKETLLVGASCCLPDNFKN